MRTKKILCVYHRKDKRNLMKIVSPDSPTVSFDGHSFAIAPANIRLYWKCSGFPFLSPQVMPMIDFFPPNSKFGKPEITQKPLKITGAFDKEQFERR